MTSFKLITAFIIILVQFYETSGQILQKKHLYAAVRSAVNYADAQRIIQQTHKTISTGTEKSPSDFHARNQRYDLSKHANVGRAGLIGVGIARYLQNVLNVSYDSAANEIDRCAIEKYAGESICPTIPVCDYRSKYRTIDGSCNNEEHPTWGQSFFPMARLLPPKYDDGLSSPRTKASDGTALPNARVISTTLAPDKDRPHNFFTIMIMQYGQFMAHDLTHGTENGLQCCNEKVMEDPKLKHGDCFSIDIPANDPFFSQYGKRCMAFVRTQPAVGVDCKPGPRQQVNAVTSVIDASQVYGSTKQLSDSLRSFTAGKLKSNPDDPNVLPPGPADGCNTLVNEKPCLKAGDTRVNEMITLSVLHQIFFREHNRIASLLAELNPCWEYNDEKIFQETRRIIAAILQHVTYNEYLPMLLGDQTMAAHKLSPLKDGYSNDYDKNVDPTIVNVFGASAFRVGHTLIQGHLDVVDDNRTTIGSYFLKYTYNRPLVLYQEDIVKGLILGLATEPSQSVDWFFTTAITNHLFQVVNLPYGLDLIAFNIQRGRERGLPPYVQWRKFCGLRDSTSFDDLYEDMLGESVQLLQKLYKNVEDIDLFVGSMLEIPKRGEFLPPTVKCILTIQFQRLKVGDRFWYENGKDKRTAFTEDQLKEIRKTSLAAIFCANSEVLRMQKNVFIQPSPCNPIFNCSEIPQMDLSAWKSCG